MGQRIQYHDIYTTVILPLLLKQGNFNSWVMQVTAPLPPFLDIILSVCHQGGEKDCEDIEGGLVMGEHWLLANSPWRQVRY